MVPQMPTRRKTQWYNYDMKYIHGAVSNSVNINIMNDGANMKIKPITYESQPSTLSGISVG